MAAGQIQLLALQVMADKGFVLWIQGIGENGLKQLLELFAKTALENLQLALMAQEDPESAMMVFAYQVYQQSTQQGNGGSQQAAALQLQAAMQSKNGATTPTPLPQLNNTYPSYRNGSKFNYISRLNGHCPEGYEAVKLLAGGQCLTCKEKKRLSLTEEMKCGGKKRITKKCETGNVIADKCGGKAKKKEDGGTLNNSWLSVAAQTNRTMNTLNRFTKNGHQKH